MQYRLSGDIGGTFTDVVLEASENRWSAKLLTTTKAPELGLLAGIDEVIGQARISPENLTLVVHGTTLATNALIERKGAKTAFLTSAGFASLLDMGYEKRFDHYDLMIDPVPAIVPRQHRFEVPERLAADGSIIEPLDEKALSNIALKLQDAGYQAVAIGFLHSFAHAFHEDRAASILQKFLGDAVTICKSSSVCPEIREYERFVTVCANAMVRPLMAGYLTRLQEALVSRGIGCPLFLMMSGGGLTTLEHAKSYPVRLIESGPAGGAILAAHIAEQCKLDKVLSFDMGGTTAKLCLLNQGEPERARLFEIARSYRNLKGSGWPVRIPVIDMVEIGAGGGSIARVDALKQITVGPDSSGSEPGPVAYSSGGVLPTVTDANLVLGKIEPQYFASGKIQLDIKAADEAISREIGSPLGLNNQWPAAGIVEIVEENMANAARVHAIEKGHDTAGSTMIAFGGGAPLHACRLAKKLGIKRIVVPKGAGVGSAIGFLRAPIAFEVTRTVIAPLNSFDIQAINQLLSEMDKVTRRTVEPAIGRSRAIRRCKAAMRYVGQGHEIDISIEHRDIHDGDRQLLRERFEEKYEANYGTRLPMMDVEIVALSVRIEGPRPIVSASPHPKAKAPSPIGKRDLFDPETGTMRAVPIFWRAQLGLGAQIEGPAIIAEDETSTIVTSGFEAWIDNFGYIQLELRT